MAETASILAQFGPVITHDDPAERMTKLTRVASERDGAGSDIVRCLPVILSSLGWMGTARDMAEALPDKDDVFDRTSLLNTLGRLGFSCRKLASPGDLREGHLPVLVLPEKSPAYVVTAIRDKSTAVIYDSETDAVVEKPLRQVTGQVFYIATRLDTSPNVAPERLKTYFKRYSGLLNTSLLLTGLSSLFALAVPVFVLLVYDRFIPTGSMVTLISLAIGVGAALLFDLVVRIKRRELINFISARIGFLAGTAMFRRLLRLPLGMTENASINSQIARARDIDRVKEFISGPAGAAVLDLPFVLIFIAFMAYIAGWLAMIPLTVGVIFILTGLTLSRTVANGTERAAKLNSERQEILMEIIRNLRAIKAAGGSGIWLRRFERISRECVKENFKNARLASTITTIGQSLTLIAGLAALGVGTVLAIEATITTGALIACMILIWRTMAPMQVAFITLTRIDQLRKSISQTDKLYEYRPEQTVGVPLPGVNGRVEFAQVMFKYPGEADPVLSNLSLLAEKGDLVAIVGKNGSGKSSVLKLIAGLYQPVVGRIAIDYCDIRQIQPRELRHMIAYVPQTPHFFHGSISDNFLMSQPMATRADIVEALEVAGAWEQVQKLPGKLDAIIDSRHHDRLSASLIMRLSLARVYLRKSPIVLLDEPITGLDFESEALFTAALDQMRRTSTVFLVTHRPSHLKLATKILVLENGVSRYFGAADQVRDKLAAHLI